MKRLFKWGCFQLILAWYDLWVGLYYDQGHRTLYFIPFPCLVFRFQLSGKKDEGMHRKDRRVCRSCDNLMKFDGKVWHCIHCTSMEVYSPTTEKLEKDWAR